MEEHSTSRIELLIGKEAMQKLKESRVAVMGIGGVGSFAAEALARAGIGSLILVDCDTVAISNLNRQIIADHTTLGRYKVEVMAERISRINPDCRVTAHKTYISEETIEKLISLDVDYVIDAIDTITSKIALVLWCQEKGIRLISSMGTGNKMDPTRFEVADIYKTRVCPLAKVMRRELKRRGVEGLKVLYSTEEPIRLQAEQTERKQTPGSMPFVPPVAGMIIAGEVIKDLIKDR
ncbi:MAG: ThiF family adenylyltransferase [Clostridiaceae bacterium]